VPTGVQRLVGIAPPRRVLPPGALRGKGGTNRSEKHESREGEPGLHNPEPTEFANGRPAIVMRRLDGEVWVPNGIRVLDIDGELIGGLDTFLDRAWSPCSPFPWER
jgi:hypothetical protein